MSHCIDIHLGDKSIDTIILHVGMKDLLNDNSQSNQGGLNKKEIQLNLCNMLSILIFNEFYLFV